MYRLANSEDLEEMKHFIRVYIVCYMYEKRDPQRKMEIISCDTSIYIMDHPKIHTSNQKEESIKCIHVIIMVKTNRMPQNEEAC